MMYMKQAPVITIDGPSGSGKGTLCHLLARELGWHVLDSGAIYRLLALAAEKQQISADNTAALIELAKNYEIHFSVDADLQLHSFLARQEVSDMIRTPEIGRATSKISALSPIRQVLLEKQRQFRRSPGLVTDGRDMGTVVFPDAQLKIFLNASLEQRAQRRYKQLKDKGITVRIEEILAELNERDARDSQRDAAPLKASSDSIIIDSTSMCIDQVLLQTMKHVRERGLTNLQR